VLVLTVYAVLAALVVSQSSAGSEDRAAEARSPLNRWASQSVCGVVQCSAVQYCVLVWCCVVLWMTGQQYRVLVQCSAVQYSTVSAVQSVQYSQCSIFESIEVKLCIVLHCACISFPYGCTALFNDPGSWLRQFSSSSLLLVGRRWRQPWKLLHRMQRVDLPQHLQKCHLSVGRSSRRVLSEWRRVEVIVPRLHRVQVARLVRALALPVSEGRRTQVTRQITVLSLRLF
jgi:hypothetical protein